MKVGLIAVFATCCVPLAAQAEPVICPPMEATTTEREV